MTQQREASLHRALLSGVDAPAKLRVLGLLSNIPSFHEAIGVKLGQPVSVAHCTWALRH
jgi:predicted metalloendopeptidase